MKRFFFLREKEMLQTPYYVIIKLFYMGLYTKLIIMNILYNEHYVFS